MIQNSSQILHFHLACAAQTEGKSTLMEKLGLEKVLEKLSDCNIKIELLTTDRYAQIKRFLRERDKNKHQFDIWHAAKSIRGKLTTANKLKCSKDLQPWVKSIDNHFWWSCQ